MRCSFYFTGLSTFLLLTSCESSHQSEQSSQAQKEADQVNFEADGLTVQKLRKELMEDDDLSTDAKNIKIIAIDGVIKLTGPVSSQEEKNKVLDHAKDAAEEQPIVDEIEVIVIETAKPA